MRSMTSDARLRCMDMARLFPSGFSARPVDSVTAFITAASQFYYRCTVCGAGRGPSLCLCTTCWCGPPARGMPNPPAPGGPNRPFVYRKHTTDCNHLCPLRKSSSQISSDYLVPDQSVPFVVICQGTLIHHGRPLLLPCMLVALRYRRSQAPASEMQPHPLQAVYH